MGATIQRCHHTESPGHIAVSAAAAGDGQCADCCCQGCSLQCPYTRPKTRRLLQLSICPIKRSLFQGYSWSLDTFVDYAWQDLLKLSINIIVLLVVEVSACHPAVISCRVYSFVHLCQLSLCSWHAYNCSAQGLMHNLCTRLPMASFQLPQCKCSAGCGCAAQLPGL